MTNALSKVATISVWVLAAICLMSQPANAEAQKPAKAPKLPSSHALLAQQAGLDAAQLQKLAQILAQRDAAVKQWNSEHGEKLAQTREAQKQAEQQGNDEARAKAAAEYRVLIRQRAAVRTEHENKIREILTPQQQLRWDAGVLTALTLRKYSRAELTEAQQLAIFNKALDASKAISEAPTAAAGRRLRQAFDQDVQAGILTEQQRQAMDLPAASTAAAGKQ